MPGPSPPESPLGSEPLPDFPAAPRGTVRRLLADMRATPADAAGLAVLAAAGLALLGVLWWLQRPVDAVEIVPTASEVDVVGQASPDAPVAAPPPSPATDLVVHVAGAVRDPGVVTVPAGSRVVEAVEAAGGLTDAADPSAVNLAEPLTDGAQVRVPVPGEPAPPPGGGLVGSTSDVGPIDLNAADAAQLETIPGVGPVTAGRIVDHRAAVGGFRSVDELLDVPGIGEATLAEIAPHVVVR